MTETPAETCALCGAPLHAVPGEPGEFAQGHVIGAKNVPLGDLEAKLAQVVKNKATPVVMVCQVGARSARAAATAQKLGYENVQSLAGGLKAWQAANMPIEKA